MATEGEWSIEKMSFVACDKVFYEARILDQNGDIAGHIGDASDAHQLVTAVNCHDELVGLVESYRRIVEGERSGAGERTRHRANCQDALDRIDAVLAKAKGDVI